MQNTFKSPAQKLFAHNSVAFGCVQAALIFCALILSWLIRFDFHLPYRNVLLFAAPLLIVCRLVAITYFGLLRGWWRYTTLNDVVDLLKAITLGSIFFVLMERFVLGITSFPRSIYLLEPLVTAGLLIGIRTFCRLLKQTGRNEAHAKKAMIVGAGFAAQMLIREMQRPDSTYYIVGCVDDDRSKLGIKVNGVPVIGTIDQLPQLVEKCPVHEILIAVPTATGTQTQRIVRYCEQTKVVFKSVPTLQDIVSGKVRMHHFRDVDIEDLLGREPLEVDLKSVNAQLEGRTVLVTGAAGTIGSELCRQILRQRPSRLMCLDQSETGIFYLHLELSRLATPSTHLWLCVADIGDSDTVRAITLKYKPDVVFHAAAYKHVPVMEWNVQSAIRNNVLSSLSFIEIVEAAGCQTFVLISSDKAVNPTSVMGVTKRIGELIISARPTNGMRCVSVRFGNVLGSNGSVIPVLQSQLLANQPLTITHPEIRRFFMTVGESVLLVLQAFAIGEHRDTLVLDMGTPVRIIDLARALIRLSGKSEEDVTIKFTGLREGEKLFEELFYPHEQLQVTSMQRIKRIRGVCNRWGELQHQIEELKVLATINDQHVLRAKLKEIVPEYSYGTVVSKAASPHPGPVIIPAERVPLRGAASAD